jgi:hypothetical protein
MFTRVKQRMTKKERTAKEADSSSSTASQKIDDYGRLKMELKSARRKSQLLRCPCTSHWLFTTTPSSGETAMGVTWARAINALVQARIVRKSTLRIMAKFGALNLEDA